MSERETLTADEQEQARRLQVKWVDTMNAEYGCPDCGVHHACGEIVAERDQLRAEVEIAGQKLRAANAERDRLRAVVEALREYVTATEGTPPTWVRHRQNWPSAWRSVLGAFEASDG